MATPLERGHRSHHAGDQALAWSWSGLRAPESFALSSLAFEPGARIPRRYRGRLFAPNVSPPLAWTPPPVGTAELVLIVQDPDVPVGHPALHALTAGIPPELHGLPENALLPRGPVPGLRHARTTLARRGWSGPLPPPGHGPHRYEFQLFALDRAMPRRPLRLATVLVAMRGHVLGRARLIGTYENAVADDH
jgi:Raf kinase inhibitor-like YbhB/YbcL family protein